MTNGMVIDFAVLQAHIVRCKRMHTPYISFLCIIEYALSCPLPITSRWRRPADLEHGYIAHT